MATEQIEEKKVDNGWLSCSLQQFFNLHQQSPNVYDLRSIKLYNESHVIMARTISEPLKMEKLKEMLLYPIVIYGDENISKNIIDHLYKISKLTSIDDDLPFYVFDGEYNDIYDKFPFLCQNKSIVAYPNMILNDQLFLGNASMATDKRVIKDLGITHIINVTPLHFELDDDDINDIKQDIKYLKLPIDDEPKQAQKMLKYFEIANNFIDKVLLNDGNDKIRILVHCEAGISRSATIIIAYLMKSRKYSLCNAYIHIKKCRPKIRPNQGFLDKLMEYEQTIFGKSTEKLLSDALNSNEITLFFDC